MDDSEDPSTYPVVGLRCRRRVLSMSSGVGALTSDLRHIAFPHSTILSLTGKVYPDRLLKLSFCPRRDLEVHVILGLSTPCFGSFR